MLPGRARASARTEWVLGQVVILGRDCEQRLR